MQLRLSRDRFLLYSIGLTLIGVGQILHSSQFAFWDWRTFAFAAAHVGTRALLLPPHVAQAFVYLPGAAWTLAPLRNMPFAEGFAVNAAVMLGAAVAAALTAQRLYALPASFCLAMILAWAPTTTALVTGQNAPIALLLVLLSLLGLTRAAPMLTAIPLGLLLYKPTLAIPLIGILLLRRRIRELGIVTICAICWYMTSVAATGGNWSWPSALGRLEQSFFMLDFSANAPKAIGLTTLLLRMGISSTIIAIAATVVIALSVPLLIRAPKREAYAAACLLGLVVSPHAWSYDAILVLPMIFVAVTQVAEPKRTRLVCAAYVLAPLSLIAHVIGFNPIAIVVVGGFAYWFLAHRRVLPVAGVVATAVDGSA